MGPAVFAPFSGCPLLQLSAAITGSGPAAVTAGKAGVDCSAFARVRSTALLCHTSSFLLFQVSRPTGLSGESETSTSQVEIGHTAGVLKAVHKKAEIHLAQEGLFYVLKE